MFAKLRVCASCEWIFKTETMDPTCPKCLFCSYGAHYVYGHAAYKYAKTQKPWKDVKLSQFELELQREINEQTSKEHKPTMIKLMRDLGID